MSGGSRIDGPASTAATAPVALSREESVLASVATGPSTLVDDQRTRSLTTDAAVGGTKDLLDARATTRDVAVTPDTLLLVEMALTALAAVNLPHTADAITRMMATLRGTIDAVRGAFDEPGLGARDAPDGLVRACSAATGRERSADADHREILAMVDDAWAGSMASQGLTSRDLASVTVGGVTRVIELDDDADDRFSALLASALQDGKAPPDAPLWTAPPPPTDRDPLQAELAVQVPKLMAAGVPIPPGVIGWLGVMGVDLFRRVSRRSVPPAVRQALLEYQEANARLAANSSADGLLVEAAVRAAYLGDRIRADPTAAGDILFGTRVGGVRLGQVATGDPDWMLLKYGLVSYLTGRTGAPDILDRKLGHVYEIKPARSALAGGTQLYGRYLFWLNLWEIGSTNPTIDVLLLAEWAARCASGDSTPPPNGPAGATFTPARVYTPGDWRPPSRIDLRDGRWAILECPVPGVICYKIVAKGKDHDQAQEGTEFGPSPENVARMLVVAMIVWIALHPGRPGAGGKASTMYRYVGAQGSPVVDDGRGTSTLAVVGGAVAAVVVIAAALLFAPVSVPAGAGAVGLSSAALEAVVLGGAGALVLTGG